MRLSQFSFAYSRSAQKTGRFDILTSKTKNFFEIMVIWTRCKPQQAFFGVKVKNALSVKKTSNSHFSPIFGPNELVFCMRLCCYILCQENQLPTPPPAHPPGRAAGAPTAFRRKSAETANFFGVCLESHILTSYKNQPRRSSNGREIGPRTQYIHFGGLSVGHFGLVWLKFHMKPSYRLVNHPCKYPPDLKTFA